MDRIESNAPLDECRMVFLHSGSRAILADPEGARPRLPRVAIPRRSRVARELQLSIKDQWGVDAIVLDFTPGAKEHLIIAIAEVVSLNPCGCLNAVCINDIPEDELESDSRRLAESILSGTSSSSRPFSRLGWMKEAVHWLSTEVDRSLAHNSDIRQYNAGGTFALVRFDGHQGPSYWLKATGSPNKHELLLTRTLANHFEDYLPRFVAHRLDWNAWVMEDFGKPLSDVKNYSAYRQTMASLGRLQIASVHQVGDLLNCGCADLRTEALAKRTPALIAYLEEAMGRQTSTKALPLSTYRLRELGRMVEDACVTMDALGIPDALIHNDINLSNILVKGSRCVFIDWAEAAIGNPLFTFEHLRLQIVRVAHRRDWMPSIGELYLDQWAGSLTERQIKKGLALAGMLAIVAHLLGRGAWPTSDYRRLPGLEASARCLARHMDRAAHSEGFREALSQ
jgi:hypothetical protein